MKKDKIKISKLNPAEYNPRTISKEALKGLKKSIEKYGLVQPIIVNTDYTVISGHQRLKVCQQLGYTEVDCIVLDLDKHEEKKLNVLMNSQAISGEFDEEKLTEVLEEMKFDDDFEELRLGEIVELKDKNTGMQNEINVSEFEDFAEIKFKFHRDDYFRVLEEINNNLQGGQTKEQLLKSLLDV